MFLDKDRAIGRVRTIKLLQRHHNIYRLAVPARHRAYQADNMMVHDCLSPVFTAGHFGDMFFVEANKHDIRLPTIARIGFGNANPDLFV